MPPFPGAAAGFPSAPTASTVDVSSSPASSSEANRKGDKFASRMSGSPGASSAPTATAASAAATPSDASPVDVVVRESSVSVVLGWDAHR
jgi:hypothetical protein